MGESLTDNNVHVLVVEDEKEIRELMALHLLRQGYKVRECASAEEAVNVLSAQKYQLCVLDWMLPGMSGVDIIGFIKKEQPQTNVLMVTANAASAAGEGVSIVASFGSVVIALRYTLRRTLQKAQTLHNELPPAPTTFDL